MYFVQISELQSCIALVGRSLLALLFIMSALMKMLNWQASMGMMADKGLPMIPELLTIAVVIELLGGFALLTGVLARGAAVLLILYLMPVTTIMHNFWAVQPAQVVTAFTEISKNLAIIGGLFLVSAFGPGTMVVRESEAKRAPEEPAELATANEIQFVPEPSPEEKPAIVVADRTVSADKTVA